MLVQGCCQKEKSLDPDLYSGQILFLWTWVPEIFICGAVFYGLHRLTLRRQLKKAADRYSAAMIRLKAPGNSDKSHLVPGRLNSSRDEIFLSKARQLVEKNLNNEHFGLKELYNGLGISRSNLHRKITSLTGASTTHFIRSIRLQKARDLLLGSELNISEIAYRVGFKSPAYFSQLFTESFGMSPSDFRKAPSESNGEPLQGLNTGPVDHSS